MVITFSYEVDGSQHSAVAGSNATLTTPESGSSSAGDLFGHFLKYFFPILTAVNIPLSLTNFLVFLKLGFLNSPSNFIYFNLVIVDLLNSAVGLKVSINLWNATDNATHYVAFWGDKKYEFERYVNNFTFDTNIVLVFGLCLIRILWMEMSALHVLEKLKTVSIAMIVLAYSYGLISCVYRFLLQKNYKYSDGTDRIFQTPLVEVKDICESLLVVLIILMSVYIQLKVWMKKSQLESSIFRAASYASCIITANVLFSYTFYIITVGVRVRHVVTSNNTYSCPGNDEGSAGGRRDGTFKSVKDRSQIGLGQITAILDQIILSVPLSLWRSVALAIQTMAYQIYLALVLSCLLVVPSRADIVDDVIDGAKDGYQNVKDTVQGVTNTQNNGNVYCWECTIDRTMDNRVISAWDEVTKSTIQGSQCENHQCQSNQDWCLVTYYRVYAKDGKDEFKKERHECGNRNLRDTDARCQQLLIEDKGHNSIVPRSCKTARSGSASVHSSVSVSLSFVLAIFSLAFLH
ncbi:hypothetical protein ACHWQZ_G016644 [Mnemiopsis leidyi]